MNRMMTATPRTGYLANETKQRALTPTLLYGRAPGKPPAQFATIVQSPETFRSRHNRSLQKMVQNVL